MVKWEHLMYDKEITELIFPYIDKVVKSRTMNDYTYDPKTSLIPQERNVKSLVKSIETILTYEFEKHQVIRIMDKLRE